MGPSYSKQENFTQAAGHAQAVGNGELTHLAVAIRLAATPALARLLTQSFSDTEEAGAAPN